MLRKLLLTAVLLMFLAPAAFAGGQLDQEIPQQVIAHMTEDHDDGEGMSDAVLAALIAGGLAFAGATLTAIVSINSRRRRNQ